MLFDGKSAKNFKLGKMTEDGLLMGRQQPCSRATLFGRPLHELTRRGQGRASTAATRRPVTRCRCSIRLGSPANTTSAVASFHRIPT